MTRVVFYCSDGADAGRVEWYRLAETDKGDAIYCVPQPWVPVSVSASRTAEPAEYEYSVLVGRWEIDPEAKLMRLHMGASLIELHLRNNNRKAEAIGRDGALSLFHLLRAPQPKNALIDLKLAKQIDERSSITRTSEFFLHSRWLWFEEVGGRFVCRASLFFEQDKVLSIRWLSTTAAARRTVTLRDIDLSGNTQD
jgi:hypothetical protein